MYTCYIFVPIADCLIMFVSIVLIYFWSSHLYGLIRSNIGIICAHSADVTCFAN